MNDEQPLVSFGTLWPINIRVRGVASPPTFGGDGVEDDDDDDMKSYDETTYHADVTMGFLACTVAQQTQESVQVTSPDTQINDIDVTTCSNSDDKSKMKCNNNNDGKKKNVIG